MALTVAGRVGCKQGSEGGGRREGKVRFGLIRWWNWVAPQFSALIGKYTLTARTIRSLWRMPRRCFSTARANTSSLRQFALPSGF